MSLLDNDAINESMINGLKSSFKEELRVFLTESANQEIEKIVKIVSDRVDVNCNNWPDMISNSRKIKVEWLITHKDAED